MRTDGKRTGVTEIDDQGRTTRIDWSYDDVGRLIRESYDSFDDSLDFITDYVFDLTGNRKEKKTDTDPTFIGNPTFDETVSYVFDNNDRLLSERLDAPGTANDRFTTYEYGPNASSGYGGDHTTRTKKTVYQGLDSSGAKLSEDGYTYTRQGRLWIAQRDTNGDGTIDQTLKYEYNDNGVRVSSEIDGTKTLFLVDENNLTGYAQVLEELGAALAVIRSYTIGLDVLSQSSSSLPSTVYSLLYDGHGSVRGLADSSGLIVAGQVYRFDAYGIAIGFDPASALTSLLYSGELYDAQLQLQYLRARWYDLSTGTFNRLDPFFGNLRDPQSLHKYAYVHGDPVQGVDPTGLFSLVSSLSVNGMMRYLTSGYRAVRVGMRVYRFVTTLQDIVEFGRFAAAIVSAIAGQTTIAGASNALMREVRKRLGFQLSDLTNLQHAFSRVSGLLNPHWDEITDGFQEALPRIRRDLDDEFARRIPAYLSAMQQRRLRFIIFLPSLPGRRGRESYIPIGDELMIAINPTGGRLLGLGFATSRRNRDQPIRIDYFDTRPRYVAQGGLHVHYHIYSDGHPPGRTIWSP